MQRKVKIKNKQGLWLAGVVEAPSFQQEFPTVMLLHGFKGYKDEVYYTDLATRLLKEGVASIRFDASGFSDSEGSIEDDYRFSNYIDDTEIVYSWLLKQDFVKKNSIGVIGQSMGGGQSILFTSHHQELKVSCAISVPDVVGSKDALGLVQKEWQKNGYLVKMSSRYGKKIKIPYDYLVDVRQYNFVEYAKKIQVPTLIVLGKKDTTVLPEQTLAVFNALKNKKQLLEFELMDHFYKKKPLILAKVNTEVVKFMIQYLK